MSLSNNASEIRSLLSSSEEKLDLKAISRRLPDLEDKAGALEELISQGLIWHAGKGRYATLDVLGIEKGRVRTRSDGSAVIFAGDVRVEVEKRDTAGAYDGDTVLVRLLEPDLHRPQGYHGRIVHVLFRNRESIAGIARNRGGKWFLDPLDPKMPDNIPLDAAGEELKAGDLIGCSIQYEKHGMKVKAEKTVGSPDSPRALIDSVCLDGGLPADFSDNVLRAAETAAFKPVEHTRKDLTGLFSITIDPIDARDFDDAISIEKKEDGGYSLGVHIADVSAYAPPGSQVDTEAFARGTSIYLPDRVIPMIPESLSNGACSLQPDQERLTKTVILEYDSLGKRTDFSVFSSRIKSRRRLNYTEAFEIIQGGTSGDRELDRIFEHFSSLSDLLDAEREKRGAVDLGASEFRTRFDDHGLPAGFDTVSDDKSHRMIENFMVEANSAVAEFCRWLEMDVLYRVHGDPVPEASDKLRRTLSIYGFSVPGQHAPSPASLSRAVLEAKDTPLFPLVRDAVLRSMQKAVYSPDNAGHYGLALRNYMHFTSPIRRYPDLMVHQAITAWEKGESLSGRVSASEAAETCSNLERRAERAERTSTELMALLFLSRRVGEVFRGVVRDKVDFGLFIRLLDVPVEGLLHVSAMKKYLGVLPDMLEPGSPVFVSVESADPLARKLSLFPAENPQGEEID